MTAPPQAPPATRRLWAVSFASATLLVLCVAGLAVMETAQQAAYDEVRRLCETLDYTGDLRWSHGYEAWLPIGTVACAGLAVLLAVLVFCVRRGRAKGALVLATSVLPLALLALMFSGLALDGFYSFPGGDISTVGTSPCGSG